MSNVSTVAEHDTFGQTLANPWQDAVASESASADLGHDVATAAEVPSEPGPEPAKSELGSTNRKPVYIEPLGLTTVFEPKNKSVVAADLVFVHGLGGHPERTWRYKGKVLERRLVTQQATKTSKSFWKKPKPPKAWQEEEQEISIFWPSDLLPDDQKNIRILTYGYDSHISHFFGGAADQSSIDQHGRSLINELLAVRAKCKSRPLIFVAHSLGGLIVKEALIESGKQGKYDSTKNLCGVCVAVMFFSTPHRGSCEASWARILSDVASVVRFDTNAAILRDLDPSSGSSKLESLRRDFHDCINQEKILVHTFQESKGKVGLALANSKVVPDSSSSFDSREYETIDTISENHMNMCRFPRREDAGYRKFLAGLQNILGKARENRQKQTQQLKELLRSFDYPDRLARQGQVLDPDPTTVHWFWDMDTSEGTMSFERWLSSNGTLFWIQGKPGSGKSTLMNHISHSLRILRSLQATNKGQWHLTRYFFDFSAKKAVSNSIEGLLRWLLYEWVQYDNAVIPHLSQVGEVRSTCTDGLVWTELTLRKALEAVLENTSKRMCILVDGLDEYEGNLLNLLRQLQSLAAYDNGATPRIKICLVSRPDPIIVQAMKESPSFQVEDHNSSGIQAYVSMTIQKGIPSAIDAQRLEEVSRTVAAKARGMFLWARFATDEIISGFAAGDRIGELYQRLDALPPEIEDIYARIVAKVPPKFWEETRLMFLLVCFARRPLKVQELIAAMETSLQVSTSDDRRLNGRLREDLGKRIKARSGGLLEIVNREGGFYSQQAEWVRLIHETVRPYLEHSGWLKSNGPGLTSAHSLWLDVCSRHIQAALKTNTLEKQIHTIEGDRGPTVKHHERDKAEQESTEGGSEANSQQGDKMPDVFSILHQQSFWLIEYAVRYMFDHARLLEAEDEISSYRYFRNIMGARFCYLHQRNGHCWFCERDESESHSTLERQYLLAGMGAASGSDWKPPAKRKIAWMIWGPLMVEPVAGSAVARSYHLAVAHGLELCCKDALNAGQYLPRSHDISVMMKLRESQGNPSKEVGSCYRRIDAGYLKLIDAECAEDKRMYRVCSLLLNRGATVGASELSQCVRNDSVRMFELLLSFCSPGPFRLQTTFDGQACEVGPLWLLYHATQMEEWMSCTEIPDFEKKLDLLLQRGEDINGNCGPAATSLHAALSVTWGGEAIDEHLIRLLVGRGSNVNADGRTGVPLLVAWRNARAAKRLLFQQDEWQRTVHLLQESGAVIDWNKGKLAPRTEEETLACKTQSEDGLDCDSDDELSSDSNTTEGDMLACNSPSDAGLNGDSDYGPSSNANSPVVRSSESSGQENDPDTGQGTG